MTGRGSKREEEGGKRKGEGDGGGGMGGYVSRARAAYASADVFAGKL